MQTLIFIIVISVLSKLTGLLRELSLAYSYGTSSTSDVYLISITITTAIIGFITPAINAAYIPIANRIEKEKGSGSMATYTRSLIAWLMIAALFAVTLGELFPRAVVSLFASGFSDAEMELCTRFVRYTILAIIPLLLVSTVSGYLQNHNKAVLVSAVPIIENIIVASSIMMGERFGIMFLPIGYTIAALVAFFPLIVATHNRGFRYVGQLSLRSQDMVMTLQSMVPVIVGASATQINTLVDRTLASRMGEGGVSVLYYADRIVGLVTGIVVIAPLTIIFPKMSKLFLEDDKKRFYEAVENTTVFLTTICLFGTICFIFFNRTVVELIFAHGAFQSESIAYTGVVLVFYVIGLIGYSLREFYTRVYYAENNYKVPFYNSLITVAVNIVLDFGLGMVCGVVGLALATAISSYVSVAILIIMHRNSERIRISIKNIGRMLLTVLPTVIIWMVIGSQRHSESILYDCIEIVVGSILFLLLIVVVKPFDLVSLKGFLKNG